MQKYSLYFIYIFIHYIVRLIYNQMLEPVLNASKIWANIIFSIYMIFYFIIQISNETNVIYVWLHPMDIKYKCWYTQTYTHAFACLHSHHFPIFMAQYIPRAGKLPNRYQKHLHEISSYWSVALCVSLVTRYQMHVGCCRETSDWHLWQLYVYYKTDYRFEGKPVTWP